MEVQKHPHHVTHTKKWNEYLLEFFMLFLAVFLGFVAENIRENIAEGHREKQFIESMVQDLQEDTTKMNQAIASNTRKFEGVDSLLNTIYATPYTDSSLKNLYRLNNYLYYRAQLFFTKRTITQLKNSGGLRLIRNRNASDSIIVYDENCEKIEKQFDGVLTHQMGAREVKYEVLDPRCKSDSATRFQLLTNDYKLMLEYANWLTTTKVSIQWYVTFIKDQKERAIRIMQFLQKEYNLE
jgi:hypothetical protein